MDFIGELFSNGPLVVTSIAWFLAQVIKIFYYRSQEGYYNFMHFFEAGGMPSAHSATVSSLTLSIGLTYDFSTPLFAVCLIIALIVMYDATGVRRAAGQQALMLNKIVAEVYNKDEISHKKLREALGHDPIEVIAGALIGILVAFIAHFLFLGR